jgi:uncharacterized membrane-anchored protein
MLERIAALIQGRYEEAASRFEDMLSRDPNRLDALVGLGQGRLSSTRTRPSARRRRRSSASGGSTRALGVGVAQV